MTDGQVSGVGGIAGIISAMAMIGPEDLAGAFVLAAAGAAGTLTAKHLIGKFINHLKNRKNGRNN